MKTGINFERCNVSSCEVHNTRNKAYIAAVNASPNKKYSIFEDKTRTNMSWVNPKYKDKTLPVLLDDLRGIYKAKVGQKPQEEDRVREITDKKTGMKKIVTTAGWSPIREGICPVKSDTTIEDFDEFINWMREKGVEIVRIDIHHDEGHTDELTKERKYNHHAHVVVDWVDHNTGKTAKLNKIDTSEMQTILAQSLGMERGESKLITGADHRTPDEQRAYAAAQKAMKLEARVQELEETAVVAKAQAYDTLQECCRTLQQLGKETVKNFDENCESGAVKPTTKEQEYRDTLEKESKRDLSVMDESSLKHEQSLLREMIQKTSKGVERIGIKLQEIASNIPTFTFLPGRKNKLLAHEAELKQKVADAQSEADKAARVAEITRATSKKYEEALLRKEETLKKKEAALKRGQQALKNTIHEAEQNARSAGFTDGYTKGKIEEKKNTDALQQKHDELKASYESAISNIEDTHKTIIHNLKTKHATALQELQQKLKNTADWSDFFKSTNPLLQNVVENFKELRCHELNLSKEELIKVFSGEVVEKTYSKMRNYKKIELPVRIEVAASTEGKMKVWYNDMPWKECLEALKARVIKLSSSPKKSMDGPHSNKK